MSPVLEHLRAHWLAQGIEVNSGASEEEVAAFERANGVVLPPLFREYVREINGMADPSREKDTMYFWPLERIVSVATLNYGNAAEFASLFAFADFLIASHDYAIDLSPEAGAASWVTVPGYKSARLSFEEFLRRYIAGDPDVIYCWAPASTCGGTESGRNRES